jgi:hypothetical protein
MDAKFALADHSDDLVESYLITVAILQSTAGIEPAGMYCENNGLKDRLVLAIKWAVNKNVCPGSS